MSDNVLRSYCGTQYRYDERGNLLQRTTDGKQGHFTWDLHNRLRRYEDDRLTVSFAYDALGRRLYKKSHAKYRDRRQAGPLWNENQRRALDEQLGCGFTWYVWEGDTLAFECRDQERHGRSTHYVFEPGTFVPVAQAVSNRVVELIPQPVYVFPYDIDKDPVWQHKPTPKPFDALAWYQCDHLGTPMELTGEDGEIAWRGTYKAWGLAEETRSDKAKWADIRNPLRFQGQYWDVETRLHYNRYRYYDPQVGRFVGKDPIGYAGGLNLYIYADSPINWLDPLGLAKSSTSGHSAHAKTGQLFHNDMNQYPYPPGYMRERRIGGVGRADAINVDECSIIERKCTCSKRTIKRGEAQLLRYCNEMRNITGESHEGILDILDPTTGVRTIRTVINKP
ncbi:hypothetical protein GLGCALEP_02888 [Pseudomonas sp. MM221]|nr:hypothetical protein GLGCALEP_02888 [Pseudomonas sp. MM221]